MRKRAGVLLTKLSTSSVRWMRGKMLAWCGWLRDLLGGCKTIWKVLARYGKIVGDRSGGR